MKNRILKWFKRNNTKPLTAQADISTVPLSTQQVDEALSQSQRTEPAQILFGCGQSVGKQRDHNEDSMFALSLTFGGEKTSYPLGLFIIADGMGGHQYGEVASATATRVMASYITKAFNPFLANPTEGMDQSIQDLMRAAINDAQRAVTQAAPGSGTTLTAALILGTQVTIGHVGDSRAYSIHHGSGEAITRDHSLVKRLEELGQISSEEAASHPQRNVLYRALGQGEVLEPDIFTLPFPQPGTLMLCSDGLWSVVPETNLFNTVITTKDLQSACQKLVAAANEAGGPDNISVILIQMPI